jgi:NitT/TauT family transport system ATP-binding protein
MLIARGIGETFGSAEYAAHMVRALEDVSLQGKDGEFVSIIGPSGCGKSTFLGIAGGLVSGYEGEIFVRGERIQGPHRAIGIVFQEESTFPWRTALGNVGFGLEMQGVGREQRERKAQEMIRLVGLTDFADRYPSELSGGMKQRVAIARALVMEPQILLMDEPFGALDEQTRIILGEELLRIRDKLGQTILFVTHNINEAVQLSDRVVVMTARPGRIKETFQIDLPRPRDSSIIASDRFGKLVAQVWNTLREESLRGFQQSETIAR